MMMMMIMTITMAILLLHVASVRIGCFDMDSQAKPKQALLLPNQKGLGFTYRWLVGNGGMGTIISTITTILPFPTNQRQV